MKNNTPACLIARGVKKFMLFGALFLALSPLPASAQDLNAWLWTHRLSAEGYPNHFDYYVGSEGGAPIKIVSLNLNFCPGYDWLLSPPGWDPEIVWNGEACSLMWVARDGYEIWQGQSVHGFILWGQSPEDAWINFQLVGIWPGTEEGDARIGWIQGHSY